MILPEDFMLIDVAILILAFFLSIPTVLGYFASAYGKNFWHWFAIGLFLPVISYFILLTILYFDERKVRRELQMSLEEDRMMSLLIEESIRKPLKLAERKKK
ncbi:MAG: hypothetical protein ACOCXH_09865 [Cyclobacteriaceae bacterium]